MHDRSSQSSTLSPEEFASWLPPCDALSMLMRQGWTSETAIHTLVGRLNAQIAIAAAENVVRKSSSGKCDRRKFEMIPPEHWNPDSVWLPDAALWLTGDIYFDIEEGTGYNRTFKERISYFAVRFDPKSIERMVEGSHSVGGQNSGTTLSTASAVLGGTPGRRQSDRWRAWVAELVAYVHEAGIPDGVGSQRQEEVISEVADRLMERGEEPLARSTVQPVVQAVLDRLRSAEK